MQQQLNDFFDTQEQSDRMLEQLTTFSQSDHVKMLIEWKVTFVGREQLVIDVLLRDCFMQIYGLGTEWLPVKLRVVYGYRYPESRPRLYFESDNMNLYYTVSGRDYMKEVASDWSQSSTLLNLLQYLAGFLQALEKIEQYHRLGQYMRGQLFCKDSLNSTEASEVYHVKVIMDQLLDRYVVLNKYDLMLFEECFIPGYLRLVEVYALKSVTSVHFSKQNSDRILLQINIGTTDMGCEILTEERERFVTSIIDKKLKSPNYDTQQVHKPQLVAQPVGLEKIKQQIAEEQSKLAQQDAEVPIDTLVCLYNQAIQYCSLVSETDHEEFLQKLQRLLSRQSSHINQKENIFPELKQLAKQAKQAKQNAYFDKLHDLSQVTCASSDLFDLA